MPSEGDYEVVFASEAAHGDLFDALAALQPITRDQSANTGQYTYSYVNIDGVLAYVRPLLAEHNIVPQQEVGSSEDGRMVKVRTILRHRSGAAWPSAWVTYPNGNNAQVQGSIITYLRRYSLLSFLGLPTEDDDGARSAQQRAPQRPSRRAEAPSAPSPLDDYPASRTHAEGHIREIRGGLSAPDRMVFDSQFREQFGTNLLGLPQARHDEALEWALDMQAYIEGGRETVSGEDPPPHDG